MGSGGAHWTLSVDPSKAVAGNKAGAKSFGKLGDSTEKAGQQGEKFAMTVIGINQALEIGNKILSIGAGLYTSTVGAWIDISKAVSLAGDDLAKAAGSLDILPQRLQVLRQAADFAGVDIRLLDKSVLKMGKTALDADRGLSTAVDLLDMVGISAHDANGELKTGNDLLLEMADAFESGVVPGGQQAAITMQLMGDRTGRMAGFLRQGRESIADVADELERYNAVMSERLLNSSEAFSDSQQRMDTAVSGMHNTLAESLLPIMTAWNNSMSESIATGGRWRNMLSIIQPQLDQIAIRVFGVANALLRLPTVIELVLETTATGILLLLTSFSIALRDWFARTAAALAQVPGMDVLASTFASLAEGMNNAADNMEAPLDRITAMLSETIDELNDAGLNVARFELILERLRQGGGGGGGGFGGGGGDGGGPDGDAPEADFIIPVGFAGKIDLVKEAEEQVSGLADQWDRGASAAGQMVSATETLLGKQTSLTGAVGKMVSKLQAALSILRILNSLFGLFGGLFPGSPAALFPLADAGRMPTRIAEGGSMGIPGLNNHSVTITRNDETIVDPVGSRPLGRMLRWFEANVIGRSQEQAPFSPSGGGMRVVDDKPVMLDGQEVGRIVGERLVEATKYGGSGFSGSALEFGR